MDSRVLVRVHLNEVLPLGVVVVAALVVCGCQTAAPASRLSGPSSVSSQDMGALFSALATWIGAAWPSVGPVLGSVGGFWLASWLAERRGNREDRRTLRDAKLMRMRSALKPLLLSSWAMQTASVEMAFGKASETKEQRNQRLTAMLGEALTGVNEARTELALETNAEQFIDQYQKVYVAFNAYVMARNDADEGDTTAKPSEWRKVLEKEVDTLNEEAKAAIALIENSV